MRDGIMNMEQVELFMSDNTHHFARKSKFVRGVLEERVRPRVDLVIKQVFIQKVEPAGLGIGNEMDLVTLLCQRFAEFGRNHATATKSRVTYYSDFDFVHKATG
jgi:hypothetical protein